MPDLLREQFPHFRPIVEAFGYRNLEFEGWEADDVIATIATRADTEGIKTCVVSTDRDAFQLCSENVCLMMTPRGVADVNVYTPERVEARYGVTPEQVPDFIGLKGDTSDNIPGVPGIGDKTAGQLIAQYGSVEDVIEHAEELSPARAQEHHRARRSGARLEGARDDAARPRHRLRPGRSSCSRRPTARSSRRSSAASSSAALLNRVDELDEAVPSAPLEVTGIEVPWREGELDLRGCRRATRPPATAPPWRRTTGSSSGRARPATSATPSSSCTTRRRAASTPRRHAARRLPDRSRARVLRARATSRPSTASSCCPAPEAEEETAALVRAAETPRRLVAPLLERLEERGLTDLYRDDRAAALGACSRRWRRPA